MCYLRNFPSITDPLPSTEYSQLYSSEYSSSDNIIFEQKNVDIHYIKKSKETIQNLWNSTLLQNLLILAQKNSQALNQLENKIIENTSLFDQISQNHQTTLTPSSPSSSSNSSLESLTSFNSSSLCCENDFLSQQNITKKLFGENKQYKYKLILDCEFSQTLFKERNFNFNLKLVDQNHGIIKNSNFIHLCLGVCDVNGNWVMETKTKENLLKGKTQSELYHGLAAFEKIYSRDVSRNYPGAKLNLVIYPKQSIIKYCQSANFLEEMVDSNFIEPLIIKDLTIRAKKKE